MATRITALDTAARARHLRRQIVDTQEDIDDMQATYVRLGERSGWDDSRLEALERDIQRFEGRVAALRQELRRLTQDVWAPEREADEPHPAA